MSLITDTVIFAVLKLTDGVHTAFQTPALFSINKVYFCRLHAQSQDYSHQQKLFSNLNQATKTHLCGDFHYLTPLLKASTEEFESNQKQGYQQQGILTKLTRYFPRLEVEEMGKYLA